METTTIMPPLEEDIKFSYFDYGLFLLMLLLSALIGVYFGFIKKQSTANDYLLGGREMTVVPIASSLIASVISGITLLAVPTDIYSYGISYWLCVPTFCIGTIVAYYVYIPVFYELGVTSTYEYLMLRFDSSVRTFASALFALAMFMYLPIVIYIPALALAQFLSALHISLSTPLDSSGFATGLVTDSEKASNVDSDTPSAIMTTRRNMVVSTGVNVNLITPIICGVCVFYTTFGGLKAVVWTDALQFIVMIGSIVVVFVLGISTSGGFGNIWQKNLEYGRLNVSFSPDITVRDSFWTGIIGVGISWFSAIACSQSVIQKCNALPNYRYVKRALIWFAIGTVTIISMSVFTGLIIFAKYSNCDPLLAGKIRKADQLLPYYVMDVAKSVPGLAGLFTSGIFSAALSTLSAVINCLSATIYEDFISHFVAKGTSEKTISNYLKVLAVVIGIICTALVYIIPYLGNLLPLAASVGGITYGAMLGIFTCGVVLPGVNSKGALWGGVASVIFMTWIIFGGMYYQSIGAIKHNPLPLMTDGCRNSTSFLNSTVLSPILNELLLNSTVSSPILNDAVDGVPFILYRMSFYYYVVVGLIVTIIVGIIVSKCTPQYNKPLNKKCYSPVIRHMVQNAEDPPDYDSLPQTDKIVELRKI